MHLNVSMHIYDFSALLCTIVKDFVYIMTKRKNWKHNYGGEQIY